MRFCRSSWNLHTKMLICVYLNYRGTLRLHKDSKTLAYRAWVPNLSWKMESLCTQNLSKYAVNTGLSTASRFITVEFLWTLKQLCLSILKPHLTLTFLFWVVSFGPLLQHNHSHFLALLTKNKELLGSTLVGLVYSQKQLLSPEFCSSVLCMEELQPPVA